MLPAVRADWRARRPGGLPAIQPVPPEGVKPARDVLGAAIDHRLRLALSDSLRLGDSVRAGAAFVVAPQMARSEPIGVALRVAGAKLFREAEKLVAELRPSDRWTTLSAADEERLARVCVVAAWFEQVYRSRRIWPGTPLGDADETVTLDHLLAAVPTYVVADIVAMTGVAYRALAEVHANCAPSDVNPGPRFTGSSDVGGADADWIAGGLLVDVKALATLDKFTRADVYQLVGYALLDYDNQYEIQQVGWYLARSGWLVTWEIETFLGLLGAEHSVGELRRRTAGLLAQ